MLLRFWWWVSCANWLCFASQITLQTQKTAAVEWDQYSLIVNGQRTMLWSADFHTWRLPVTDLWYDVLQKLKAASFNAISIYVHWGLIEPAPGQIDFGDWRQLKLLFHLAQQLDLWVIVRPGPYINAETSFGGLPGWVAQLKGDLRSNDTDYYEAWQGYIRASAREIRPFQITNGGPVIAVQLENELSSTPKTREYMHQLRQVYRDEGIDVPLTFNDASTNDNFATGGGAADIYGFDSYPQRFDCSHPLKWNGFPEHWHNYHLKVNPSQPLYIPEYQAGAFDPFAGPGYKACANMTGASFERVFYYAALSANAKMVNLYMGFGGTSWGHLAYPGVYTSYDYGSPIAEDRSLRRDKFGELRLIGYFLKSVPQFTKTDWLSSCSERTSNTAVSVTELRNPDTKTGFYFYRQRDVTSNTLQTFKTEIQTSLGRLTVPSVGHLKLNGRDAVTIVTDFSFGNVHIILCTASIFYTGHQANQTIIAVHSPIASPFELTLETARPDDSATSYAVSAHGDRHWNVAGKMKKGYQIISNSDLRLIIVDTETAYTFWNVDVKGRPYGMLLSGPYLIRNATVHGKEEAKLCGDITEDTQLTIFSEDARRMTWNEQSVPLTRTSYGPAFALLSYQAADIQLPNLPDLEWKYKDSLPETKSSFDSTDMTPVKHSLYANDYGFFAGTLVYRGTFNGNSNQSDVEFAAECIGGSGSTCAAYLNGRLLVSNTSLSEQIQLSALITTVSTHNVLVILVDHQGGEESSQPAELETAKNPRGLISVKIGTADITWHLQGNQGGHTSFADRLRGVYNTGGLFSERHGWHLPEFNDSAWSIQSPFKTQAKPGVSFFRTSFELDLPEDYDVTCMLSFSPISGARHRVQLFVNGWQFGKYVANLGPQTQFPLPAGILQHKGQNTLALSVWTYGNEPRDLTLSEAIQSKLLPALKEKTAVYEIDSLDPEWLIASVEHGGYVLAVILQACQQHQQGTAHPDACHVTAQYLVASTSGPKTQIQIRILKKGRQYTNLVCKLIQNGKVNVRAQVLMTSLPATPNASHRLTLLPPQPGARRIPTLLKPHQATAYPLYAKMRFKKQCTWAKDPYYEYSNQKKLSGQDATSLDRNGVLEWGSYVDLHQENGWSVPMLGFAGDMFENLPEHTKYKEPSWFPTMSLSLQIFAKPQLENALFSKTKVFIYSHGTIMYSGVHDATVEVWTAPSEEACRSENWRDHMICLARCSQMALVMPIAINTGMQKAKL